MTAQQRGSAMRKEGARGGTTGSPTRNLWVEEGGMRGQAPHAGPGPGWRCT
jgi:hypothetical protein